MVLYFNTLLWLHPTSAMKYLLPFLCAVPLLLAQDDELAKKPITTRKDKVGQLLEQWHKEGTAAGNVGDVYDNRDGAHSDLNTAPFPQLRRHVYTEEDLKLKRHWAAIRVIRPQVTFGNSSTSAPPQSGGSNVRMYYTQARGLAFLYEQYTKNNLYIYPEHRDHDPGHNGFGDGYGDLYPTNTPYLIASQGSSGSDQPFMRAVPTTLAAFRPDVKKRLIETGMLMPTLQYVFRLSNKQLKSPEEYLTGKAHPTVFEGSNVDDLKMIQLAHELTLETLPPMVKLEVVEEDQPKNGVDYFEPAGVDEKLADTPSVIARIVRGKEYQRRMVVRADGSSDPNKKALTYHWVVLRGDAERIQIKKLDAVGSKVELLVAYHERRPIAPGSLMESNRVDIGVFVHNGKHYSPPGFVTFYSLDSEARVYQKNRIVEIAYGMGENRLTVANWQGLTEKLMKEPAAAEFLSIPPELAAVLGDFIAEFQKRGKELNSLKDEQFQAQAAKKVAKTDEAKKAIELTLTRLQKEMQAATKAVEEVPTLKFAGRSLKPAIELGLAQVLNDARAFGEHPSLVGEMPFPHEDTPYARAANSKQRGAAIAKRFQGLVNWTHAPNFIDQRLSSQKVWRDVYAYDAASVCTGWRRHHAGKTTDFTADGLKIEKIDDAGRPTLVRVVRYEADFNAQLGIRPPLRFHDTDEAYRVEYEQGKAKRVKIEK